MNNYYNSKKNELMNSDFIEFNPMSSINAPIKDNYVMPTTGSNLFDSYNGFIRGNMFANLYEPYTSNEPHPLTPANEREALLNRVREYGFALIDLNLYLDTHPEDRNMINTYNQYLQLKKQTEEEYERRYGPLALSSGALNTYPWAWLTPPWPWEVK